MEFSDTDLNEVRNPFIENQQTLAAAESVTAGLL
jgi:nicotinamide mononucleotide (NMN) deamidase PncC